MWIEDGYYGVRKVSCKTMIMQDILHNLYKNKLLNWTCYIPDDCHCVFTRHVYVNPIGKEILLCPVFLETTDYKQVKESVFKILLDSLITKKYEKNASESYKLALAKQPKWKHLNPIDKKPCTSTRYSNAHMHLASRSVMLWSGEEDPDVAILEHVQ